MNKIKTPPFLKVGDTIGITAPSFGCTIEPYISRFYEAKRQFEELGYNLKIGETVFKNDGIGISTNPKVAAKELTDFYCDSSINIIISAGGGELMCETLSHIDFEKIKNAPPKWFMGHSDNTNFIFPLVTCCNIKAIYGNNITGFGKPWENSENDAIAILKGEKNFVYGFDKFQNPEDDETELKKVLKIFPQNAQNKFNGILIGGCLDVLSEIAGTRFDFVKKFNDENQNVIWALEACDLNPIDIRRAIWHLKECDWFKNASGFLIGRPLAAWKKEILGVNQYNAITDILGNLNVPIIMDADFGHISPDFPLVMGAETSVEVENGNIKCTFEL